MSNMRIKNPSAEQHVLGGLIEAFRTIRRRCGERYPYKNAQAGSWAFLRQQRRLPARPSSTPLAIPKA